MSWSIVVLVALFLISQSSISQAEKRLIGTVQKLMLSYSDLFTGKK